MLKKKCRAIACPRRIHEDALFCDVHLRQLSPAMRAKVAENREPNGNDPADTTRIITGTREIVASIAKSEGRARDLAEAVRSNEVEPENTTGPTTRYASDPAPFEHTTIPRTIEQ